MNYLAKYKMGNIERPLIEGRQLDTTATSKKYTLKSYIGTKN